MSRDHLVKAVIQHLQAKGYTFMKFLGEGGFADVISVLTPDNKPVAVKIVEKKNLWTIEDIFWPILRHQNILQVTNVLMIEELAVKLYFMPILQSVLDVTVESKNFKKDPNNLKRVKKWLHQILSAIEYLHSQGYCHLDIKTDNVLIDEDDNAVLADFSGLNFTKCPLDRLCSPLVFRPPECFTADGFRNVQGQFFDMWTYGILVLNVLTGHYFHLKTSDVSGEDWWMQMQPILMKALKESKFQRLMKKAFPHVNLSANDIHGAMQFVNSLLKIEPVDRPSATTAKNDVFLKMGSNSFPKIQCYDSLPKIEKVQSPAATETSKVTPNRRNVVNKIRSWFRKKFNRVLKKDV